MVREYFDQKCWKIQPKGPYKKADNIEKLVIHLFRRAISAPGKFRKEKMQSAKNKGNHVIATTAAAKIRSQDAAFETF